MQPHQKRALRMFGLGVLAFVIYSLLVFVPVQHINSEYEEKQRVATNECRILMSFAEDKRDTLLVLKTTVGDGYTCIRLFSKNSVIE